jgi:MinD superfamily P-loop ATPase
MKIAVLSGKGGTGKTMVSVNLAAVAGHAAYVDCDVEEPNGHLFFKPNAEKSKQITVKIPEVDMNRCDGCRKCVDFCMFNALAHIGSELIVFESLCHSCGGCMLVCPQQALSEKEKVVGSVWTGISGNVAVHSGMMNIGEASGIPIIRELLREIKDATGLVLIDCPPGSACTVMESIKDADYCVLVAEPSIFGAHNLNLVVELVRLFHKPHGVLLNKCMEMENPSEQYCIAHGVPIIGKLPYDYELAKINGAGLVAVREAGPYLDIFAVLLDSIRKETGDETAAHS